ncbi:MAG: hypothetical protein WC263_02590 [Candidatus Micrarchaeia archaeon]|jgi:hypothetical protein
MTGSEDEFPAKEKKKPYSSLRKLARKSDIAHARRERKKQE